jgi:hypothetical protein
MSNVLSTQQIVVIDAREGVNANDITIVTNLDQLKFVLVNSSSAYGPEAVATRDDAVFVMRVCEHLRVSELLYALVREIPARVQALSLALDTPFIDYGSAARLLTEIERIARVARVYLEPAHATPQPVRLQSQA